MQNSLFLLILLAISSLLYGQEIDQSWFYKPDVKFTQVHTFNPDTTYFDVNEFGVDQVWDFSIEPFNTLIDTTWFLDPSEMVFGEHYPDATVGRRNINPFYDWEWYFKVEGDTIFDQGTAFIRHVGGNLDTTILTYGPDISVPVMISDFGLTDSLYNGENNATEYVTFQGHGTVITAITDTFNNCVLLKYQSTFSNDFRYVWYQDDLTKEVVVYIPEESGSPEASLDRMIDYWDLSQPSKVISAKTLENINFTFEDGLLKITSEGASGPYHLGIYNISGELLYADQLTMKQSEVFVQLDVGYIIQPVVIYLVDQKTNRFLCKKIICN